VISIFKINPDGLEAARAHLGIRWQVRITIRAMGCGGRYVGTDLVAGQGGQWAIRHRLTTNCRWHPDDAEISVWHELTHALQAERCGGASAFNDEWMRQLHEAGLTLKMLPSLTPAMLAAYRSMPFEAEADRISFDHPKHIRVTVPR
jgi:hypothetical protein